MTKIIATKENKQIVFEFSETETVIRGKNVTIDEIQLLMDNDVHNGSEFDGWTVNFD